MMEAVDRDRGSDGGSPMGMFDNLKDQALKAAKEHHEVVENVAEQGVEKAGDLVDGATGGKYATQVDAVQAKAPEQIAAFLEK